MIEIIVGICSTLFIAMITTLFQIYWKFRLLRSAFTDLARDLPLLEFRIPEYKQTTEIIDEFDRRKKRLVSALENARDEFKKQSNSNWIRPNSELVRWFEFQCGEIESILEIVSRESNEASFELMLIFMCGSTNGNLYESKGKVHAVYSSLQKLSREFSEKADELDLFRDYLPFSSF